MTLLIVVICGAAGGFIGWLLGRRAEQTKAQTGPQAVEACETST